MYFEKRGLYENLEVEISSSFPVGLFERFYSLSVPLNLVVFPKPLKASESALNSVGKKEGITPRHSRIKGYEELEGIREYTNEPIKLIHWKI